MLQISAYIHFDGNCREAMTFYQACLGGELTLYTIGESPLVNQMPPEMHTHILHARLTGDTFTLLGSDMVGAEGIVRGNSVTLSFEGTSETDLRACFARLASEGKVNHALEASFWGGIFGELTDKYSINWMFNFDKNAQA